MRNNMMKNNKRAKNMHGNKKRDNNVTDNFLYETEDSIDEFLDGMKLEEEPDLSSIIEQKINQRIMKIALRTVMTVLIIVALIFLGISPVMSLIYTTPVRLDSDAKYNTDGQIESQSTLFRTLDAWIETQIPFGELDYVDIHKEGFGKYEIRAHVFDLKDSIWVGAAPNACFSMERGHMTITEDATGMLSQRGNILYKEWGEDISEDRKLLEGLPASSRICAVIHTKSPTDIVKVRDSGNDDMFVMWTEVYTEGEVFRGGINFNHVLGTKPESEVGSMNDSELKDYYVSRLQLLADNSEIWEDMGIEYNLGSSKWHHVTSEPLLEAIDKVSARDRFETEYFCVMATRDELIKYMDAHDFASVKVISAELATY